MFRRRVFSLLLLCAALAAPACTRKAEQPFTFAEDADAAAELPWKPWGPEAFAAARESNRPVFLSLNSTLCFWCRLLDASTFGNERVQKLLTGKFVLVRADVEAFPALAERYAETLPTMAVLSPDGDLLWRSPFLQPTDLNAALYKVLRGETGTLLPAHERRFKPVARLLHPDDVNAWMRKANEKYDYGNRGYGFGPKEAAPPGMVFDVFGGMRMASRSAATRLLYHVQNMGPVLGDAEDGGFYATTRTRRWDQPIPLKRADEQVRAAAALLGYVEVGVHVLPEQWEEGRNQELPPGLREAAGKAVDYVLGELLDASGGVHNGAYAPDSFGKMTEKGWRDDADFERDRRMQADVTARTALWLSRAGRWAQRADWVAAAAKMMDWVLAGRDETGLLYHLPAIKRHAGWLGDHTAALEATLELYQSTGDDRYLKAGEELLTQLDRFADGPLFATVVTETAGTPLVAELSPVLNAEAARGLWRAGVLLVSPALRVRALRIIEVYAGAIKSFGDREEEYILSTWLAMLPPLRLELPRAWKDGKALAFTSTPDLRPSLRWTDEPAARLCVSDLCAPPIDDERVLAEAANEAVVSGRLPKVTLAPVAE